MPLQPPPAGSLRARILAGETLFGSFLDVGSAILGGALRGGRLRLAARRPRARRRRPRRTCSGQLHAIEVGGSTAIVRPQSGERIRIGRALDLGARGIMVPRLETAEEAREARARSCAIRRTGSAASRSAFARRRPGRGRPRRRRGGSTSGRRDHPDRVAARRLAERRRDRRDRRRRRPVRRPGRPVALARASPASSSTRHYLAALAAVVGRLPRPRQGRRDPRLRHRRRSPRYLELGLHGSSGSAPTGRSSATARSARSRRARG